MPLPRLTNNTLVLFAGRSSTIYEKCRGFDVVTEQALSQDENSC
jgi:hypothetical protein